jgi:hypothetical protein
MPIHLANYHLGYYSLVISPAGLYLGPTLPSFACSLLSFNSTIASNAPRTLYNHRSYYTWLLSWLNPRSSILGHFRGLFFCTLTLYRIVYILLLYPYPLFPGGTTSHYGKRTSYYTALIQNTSKPIVLAVLEAYLSALECTYQVQPS